MPRFVNLDLVDQAYLVLIMEQAFQAVASDADRVVFSAVPYITCLSKCIYFPSEESLSCGCCNL